MLLPAIAFFQAIEKHAGDKGALGNTRFLKRHLFTLYKKGGKK
jgi:hypothetical protein